MKGAHVTAPKPRSHVEARNVINVKCPTQWIVVSLKNYEMFVCLGFVSYRI